MRKLAIVCGGFSLAILAAHYLLPASWLLPLSLCLVLPGIGLILFRRRWLLPLILTLCGLAAGFYAYAFHQSRTLDLAHSLDGQTVYAQGRVLTAPSSGDGWRRVEVELSMGERTKLTGILYDPDGSLKKAKPGDQVEGSFSLRASDVRNGERYDNNPARGIYVTANASEDFVLTEGGGFTLRGLASLLHERICGRIRTLFPEDTYAFFQALLLGEKSELYQNDTLELSMSRAGLMHIVAVSGMHIAFLVGMLRQLLGNTRRSSILCILLIWSFVLVTGSSPSAVRAGVMQTIALLAPVFRREDDPPTSLLFALGLILLFNPCAIGSVSLQLSFSSLAGILLLSDRIRQSSLSALPKAMPRFLRNYLSSNLANSVGVLVFTTPLIALHFGYVSILSPLTNLLTLWAVPICFGFGYLACLLAPLSLAAAGFLASALSWLARYIAWVAKIVSAPGFACLYLCLKLNWLWIALVYLLFLLGALLFRPGWKRWFFPTGFALFSLIVLLTASRLRYESTPGYVTAVDVGQGQSLVVMNADETVVIDCGNINSLDDAGDLCGSYLRSRGRDDVDLLVLTHLHTDHADGVLRLMEYLPVREILIGPEMEDPNGLFPAIEDKARRQGTLITVIDADTQRSCGKIGLSLFVPVAAGNINERCLSAVISVGDFDMLVTGDMNQTAERALLRGHELHDLELLVVGHHGSKYAACDELLSGSGAHSAIVSSGYNTFGHPAPETLARLAQYAYHVYRTDEEGTVELRIP